MKTLDHPHIVRFVDTYTLDKSVSILMSPVADFDLGYFMSKHQTLEQIPADSVIQWFSCLASSIEYLHRKSIKHQDIKPSNILIKGRRILLADFGIAKTFVDSDSTVSTSGDMTWKYCSPETAHDGLRGRKADIFSLGCVFLEIFSFLLHQGQPEFGYFQEHYFIGDRTYQENLPMVKLWLEGLRREPAVEKNPVLRQLLDSCKAMLERSSKNRPSAADLSATLPPGKCCLPTENESDPQSAMDEGQTVSLDMGRPLPHQNSPQSTHLDDQTSVVEEQVSKARHPLDRIHEPFDLQMSDRSGNSQLSNNLMIKRTIWSSGSPLFSLFLRSIGVLFVLTSYLTMYLLKALSRVPQAFSVSECARAAEVGSNPTVTVQDLEVATSLASSESLKRPWWRRLFPFVQTDRKQAHRLYILFSLTFTLLIGLTVALVSYFKLKNNGVVDQTMPTPTILPQSSIFPIPDSSIGAADAVIGTYFSATALGVLQTKTVYNGGRGKICIYTKSVKDWLDVQCSEGANAKADTPLTVLDWLGGPR
jgi:serine/threonine protein kinase